MIWRQTPALPLSSGIRLLVCREPRSRGWLLLTQERVVVIGIVVLVPPPNDRVGADDRSACEAAASRRWSWRGKGIASPDQPREPKQSWRPPGTNRPGCARSRQGTELAESRFQASRVTFVRRQRPYRRSPRSRSKGCFSARAKRSSHRCRDKRCSVSGHENPASRVLRVRRVLAGHRAQGNPVVENAVGHAVLDDGLRVRAVSVAAPATCPGAPRARIGLCRSPTRSPFHQPKYEQALGGEW